MSDTAIEVLLVLGAVVAIGVAWALVWLEQRLQGMIERMVDDFGQFDLGKVPEDGGHDEGVNE